MIGSEASKRVSELLLAQLFKDNADAEPSRTGSRLVDEAIKCLEEDGYQFGFCTQFTEYSTGQFSPIWQVSMDKNNGDNDTIKIFFSRDDEGNGPGAMNPGLMLFDGSYTHVPTYLDNRMNGGRIIQQLRSELRNEHD